MFATKSPLGQEADVAQYGLEVCIKVLPSAQIETCVQARPRPRLRRDSRRINAVLLSHVQLRSPTMFSSMLRLLATGFLASVTLAAGPFKPVLRNVTQRDVDAALAPFPGIKFTQPNPHARRSASDKRAKDRLQLTDNWTPLKAYHGPRAGRMSVLNTLGHLHREHDGHGYENITASNVYGSQYNVDVWFNKQKLSLVLDTGSSDTWAFGSKSNCTGYYSSCYAGPSFAGSFNDEAAHNEHLYITYGDGELIQGPMGYMTVSVAGLQVENQTVALANETFWFSNNVTSGVLGLAYPSITNGFFGDFGEHAPWLQEQYPPVFSNMVAQGLSNNYFSVAINRPGSRGDGALAFGGVPDLVGVNYSAPVAITDIIIVCLPSSRLCRCFFWGGDCADWLVHPGQPRGSSRHFVSILVLHHHSRRLAVRLLHRQQKDALHHRYWHHAGLPPTRYTTSAQFLDPFSLSRAMTVPP